MEHLWSPAGATGGNQWQMGERAGFEVTERRQSRTDLPAGYAGVPVLKTGTVIRAIPHGCWDCAAVREGARHDARQSADHGWTVQAPGRIMVR
jgi:hypothetical protein